MIDSTRWRRWFWSAASAEREAAAAAALPEEVVSLDDDDDELEGEAEGGVDELEEEGIVYDNDFSVTSSFPRSVLECPDWTKGSFDSRR